MDVLRDNLVYLLPLIILQAALALTALIHVLRHNEYKYGNRVVWVLVVIFIGFIGPILYFAIGKGDE
ncbi:hypothetical protein SH1V18_01340 [Vallitalea longa]|uniref:Cardiolipin synthase N-terminal domain-containing protein n=1 Tax=Vallitalea longa TaxID=2936439 RepID=A0A9W5Y949_9FIRM|nr:PLDc N-terminal domain-containing protein [Vallitalea longa]GKX27654.1 hypothetical protein SH1V18_01340 [Vallitalea longa]